MANPPFSDQVRDVLRVQHHSLWTGVSCLQWIKRSILSHGKRHSREMGEQEITPFLTHLAVDNNAAASTRNQTLASIPVPNAPSDAEARRLFDAFAARYAASAPEGLDVFRFPAAH